MNKKVKMFGDEIIELDKKVIVTLDNSLEVAKMFEGKGFENYTYAGDLKHLMEQIKERKPFIITPLTRVVDSWIMEMGYDIFIQNGKELICFSDLLDYKDDGVGSFGREIRITQNWEKMLYSGCFNIEIPDWRDSK